jgi:predicted amidohydrolase
MLLHSRYRKFNLFGEKGFSITPEAELSFFETDFGVTFGMFICFDVLFQEPAVSLVTLMGITDFVYPTAWFSELPFLSGEIRHRWDHAPCRHSLFVAYHTEWGGGALSGPCSDLFSTSPSKA